MTRHSKPAPNQPVFPAYNAMALRQGYKSMYPAHPSL
jgi:hypothetical protein